MKTIVSFISFLLVAITLFAQNAQNQEMSKKQKLEEVKRHAAKTKAWSSKLQEQLSPYNEKSRNLVMNPQMPDCRDVSRFETIDNGTIRILYAFNALDIANPQTYDDLQRLEIGTNHIKYYGYYVFQTDSVMTDDCIQYNKIMGTSIPLEGGPVSVAMKINGKHQGWSQYLFSEFFKDLSKNELTEYCRMPGGLQRYNSYYTETIPAQERQIAEETIEIAGYTCQKATCRFRGRDYTAWFAVDIPIPQGPWKFCGLPGLILKVYDAKEKYVFECVGIEQHTQAYPIIRLDNFKQYHKTTRAQLDKLLKSVCENYYQLSGLTKTVSKRLFPYNPMELK